MIGTQVKLETAVSSGQNLLLCEATETNPNKSLAVNYAQTKSNRDSSYN